MIAWQSQSSDSLLSVGFDCERIQTNAPARRFSGSGGPFHPRSEEQMAIELTVRDSEILSVLSNRLRVLAVVQVAKTWFADTADPLRQARKRVRRLVAAGYLTRDTVMAHRPLPLYEEKNQRWKNLSKKSLRQVS